MSRRRFHGLKRVGTKIKIRMSWNKYNLFNLSRFPSFGGGTNGTYFQQKWAAKSSSRAYHGEQIREKQWQRMFTPRLNAVVPINHQYLALYDGSELAAGRGSGKDEPPSLKEPKFDEKFTPYMHMTFAPIERRLDVAIFRSLFASSARQARQFVVHGGVKVNGKKMPYPGYLLNPGDMFQVEPERVLFATGQGKTREQVRKGREALRQRREWNTQRAERRVARKEARLQAIANAEVAKEVKEKPKVKIPGPPLEENDARKQRKADLQMLAKQIKSILENRKTPPPAKRKQELRAVNKEIKTALSNLGKKPVADTEAITFVLTTKLTDMYPGLPFFARIVDTIKGKEPAPPEGAPAQPKQPLAPAQEKAAIRQALARSREAPLDLSKPYASPWTPRPYMSAFAFIPRYLEVNHNICSAVYLRHPVARPGLAEVPTPFGGSQMQLAFNWYLRRR